MKLNFRTQKFKNSNLSILLLEKIFDEIEVSNYGIKIEFNDDILIFNDKILIPFNYQSIKIRRKDKDKYDFIDFFEDENQNSYFIELFTSYKKLKIRIKRLGINTFIYELIDKNFNVYYKMKFIDNHFKNNCLIICKYFNII